MSVLKSTIHSTRPPGHQGLWYYRERDKEVTRLVLDGKAPKDVGHVYGLSNANVIRVVRTTCERLRPDWVDRTGRSRAWSTTLSGLRAERGRFPV